MLLSKYIAVLEDGISNIMSWIWNMVQIEVKKLFRTVMHI